jgi:hypothetical protein
VCGYIGGPRAYICERNEYEGITDECTFCGTLDDGYSDRNDTCVAIFRLFRV